MTELKLLAPDEVRAWEGRLWPYFHGVCARSRGRYEPQHFLNWAITGEWQIWLALDGTDIRAVCGTEVIVFPTGVKAIAFRFCTGSGREDWQPHVDTILAWGKSRGCVLSEGVFRKGWMRVLDGWSFSHVFLERTLDV